MAITVTSHSRRGLPVWGARAVALLLSLVAACATVLLTPTTASAHPLSTSAILLDIGPNQVTGQIQLPIDRLAIAINQPGLTTTKAAQSTKTEEIRQYIAAHVSASDATDEAPWDVSVTGGHVETIDGVDHLVYDIALRPSKGPSQDFELHYNAIVDRLLSHKVFVSSRPAGTEAYTAVGLVDWESHTLTVPVQGATLEQGFLAAIQLGIHHIAEGADHLLFLLMLLLPAPLLAQRHQWVRTDNLRRNWWRVVHVVTAFAIGHSITLALAAFGYLHAPARLVESMIALSILVSGLHAVRPIIRGGEIWIAAGFGLMHGLAFAALLGQIDLGRGSLVTELFGFNLGIELTQLLVVALVMPSLLVLSRTRAYPAVRLALAALGVVLAAAWLAERTTLINTNPLEPVSNALVAHPIPVVAVLALAAATAWSVPGWRVPPDQTAAAGTGATPAAA